MDSISRYEYHEIFDRVSLDIDLKYCTNALAIEQALIEVRSRCKAKSKISRTKTGRARYGRRAEWLDTLIETDFAGRAIFEAHRKPHGIIATTLKYGRQEAAAKDHGAKDSTTAGTNDLRDSSSGTDGSYTQKSPQKTLVQTNTHPPKIKWMKRL